MNGLAAHARAIVVVLAATAVVGVARTTHYALRHDPHGGGSVVLWAWLLAPLAGGLAGALLTAVGQPRSRLRRGGLTILGAAGGDLLGLVTFYVMNAEVACYGVNGSDDCGFGLVVSVGIGDALLFVVLALFGAALLLFSRPPGKLDGAVRG